MGYNLEELMAVAISRDLKDGEIGFVGTGTGGRAFTLVVGVPLVAMGLAQLTHAPNLTAMIGQYVNPKIDEVPETPSLASVCEMLRWKCEARIHPRDIFDLARRGGIDVGFGSAAQVDKYGNANIVVIGDYHRPKVRFMGCILQTEHFAIFNREILLMDHERRRFVEKVDFVSGVGYLTGGDSRRRTGLKRGGPSMIVTNLAILSFDEGTRRMTLTSVHPGVSLGEVERETGFELLVPDRVHETPPPTEEEIRLIRTKIDPRGVLIPR